MRRASRILLFSLAALLAIGVFARTFFAYEPAIKPAGPRSKGFDATLVQQGASLAAIGNCRGCHTSRDGPALGGGVPLHSPLGIIYSTNISPDPETGIGRWSEEAFVRAMRKGVARDGSHLYPAFPYERFTHTTDADLKAIYAWAMSQAPVKYRPPKNTLPFPFNIRAGIAFWKLAFLDEGPRPAGQGPNARGDYLVDSLGHCGGCHSPRNWAYAEDRSRELQGGDLEGWHAYAIQADNKAVHPWKPDELAFYLQNGWHSKHGISRGTMGLVTGELAWADPAEVEAIARAIVARMQPGVAAREKWSQAVQKDPMTPKGKLETGSEAAAIYEASCAQCHAGWTPLPFGAMPLSMSTGLSGEKPRNLINVIVHGLRPAGDGETSPVMPAYGGALTDAQIEALVNWLRANLTDQPPWQDVRHLIEESRRMEPAMLAFPPGGSGADPVIPGAR